MKAKYRSKETITAYPYKEGMEEGFVTRYYDDEDVDPDGTIHTSGFSGKNELKVPYITNMEGHRVLVGERYIIIETEKGIIRAMLDTDFENKYELIK